MRTFFAIGGAKEERLGKGDLLHLPVEDGYRQIGRKVVSAMEWVLARVRFKYLLKVAMDMGIRGYGHT